MSMTTSHRRLLGLSLSAVGLAALVISCAPNVSDRTVGRMSPTEVAELLATSERVALLDARFRDQRDAQGSIPGAVHVRLADFDDRRAAERYRGQDAVVVFGQDPASGAAIAIAKTLQTAGISDVVFMEQGFRGWSAAGLPVAKANTAEGGAGR